MVVVVSGRSLLQEVKVDDACQTDMPLDVFRSQAFLVFAGSFFFKAHSTKLPLESQAFFTKCDLRGVITVGSVTVTMVAALEVLAGKLKPNLGRFDNPPDWQARLESCFGFRTLGKCKQVMTMVY